MDNPFEETEPYLRPIWLCALCGADTVSPDYGNLTDAPEATIENPWYCSTCQQYQDYPMWLGDELVLPTET